jgi:hypothetical protein
MQSPAVKQTLKRRRELTRTFQAALEAYAQRHKKLFHEQLPSILEELKQTERHRVAATRDCITMYTGSFKSRDPSARSPAYPFAATLAAAEDVTDASAAATRLQTALPPLPIFYDPAEQAAGGVARG